MGTLGRFYSTWNCSFNYSLPRQYMWKETDVYTSNLEKKQRVCLCTDNSSLMKVSADNDIDLKMSSKLWKE